MVDGIGAAAAKYFGTRVSLIMVSIMVCRKGRLDMNIRKKSKEQKIDCFIDLSKVIDCLS